MGGFRTFAAATVAALAIAAVAPGAQAKWKPQAPTYGVYEQHSVPVRMSDGTVLRANVYFPADPHSGKPAAGRFPVIMVQTPYGKDTVGAGSGGEIAEAATQAGPLPYFVQRGFIDVVAEVRGTGDSGGTFNLLDPVQGRDGAELVRWAARLPNANGRVGLYGPSYMGLDQYMTAAALAPKSPLKAMFPIVAGNDTYRDVAFDGGILDAEFDVAVVATIFGPLEELNPIAEATSASDLLAVERQHIPALLSYNAAQIANITTGGDEAYDGSYWQQRAPRNMLAKVVSNNIPAYIVDGYFDLYQRGAPLDYSGLQNLWAHRPVGAPMNPRQRVTGRYQLLQGPWYHLTAGSGFDIYGTELAWFDRWLRGERTRIDRTRRPLHVYELGSNRWVDTTRFPFAATKPTTLYLNKGPSHSGSLAVVDGTLTRRAPRSPSASDATAFSAASSPCSRAPEQWGFGGGALVLEVGQLPPDPCTTDDRPLETTPGALTYTTAPFRRPTVLAGPLDASIYATASKPEVELVANVEDVAPDGRSFPLSSGALLGSFRALDAGNTWFARHRRPLAPYHPYTKASAAPVPVGSVVRYDIEIFPIVDELLPGHRLRLTLTTSDLPHLLPLASQAATLAGGVYRIERSVHAPSYLEAPLAAATAFDRR